MSSPWDNGSYPRDLSPRLRVEFAGFVSDTFTLQRAGWKISMLQNRGELQVALKHDGLRLEGLSDPIRLPFKRQWQSVPPDYLYGNSYLDNIVVRVPMLGSPLYIHTRNPLSYYASFEPVDATPQFTENPPKNLSECVLFAPVVQEEKQLIIKPEEIGRVLDMIAAAQEPAQEEIRARMRQRERREGYKNVLHAQLYSVG